jgi:putative peptidoglycan lipid II flippase
MIKIFAKPINSITIAALLVALSSLVSRLLGIFRDRILAGEFGAGDTLDIYYASFRIPDLIFNLLVLGALSAGFVPIMIGLIKEYDVLSKDANKAVWRLSNNLINIMGCILIILAVLGFLTAPWLMRLIAPGFDPDKLSMAADLTRIMFLSPLFLGISSILGGILQSFKRFFIYSLSPIFYNLGIIIGALYFVPIWGVYGLAWGVVLGAFMHMCVQLPAVLALGYRYEPAFDVKDKNLRKMGYMMVPRFLSLAVSQINLLIITVIASTLASGSLAIFNFANNLQSFPIGIFGLSFALAAFPALSAVAFDRKKLIDNFSNVFRQILFFIVPSTILLLTLRAQIIRVVFGTGEFGWSETVLTINTLGFFSLSLFAQASLPLIMRVFYARQNSKTPFYAGLAGVALNVVLSLYFAKFLGVAGLALAFSIANIFNFVLLWLFLRQETGHLDEARIFKSAAKFSIAGLMAGAAVQGAKLLIWPYVDMTRVWGVFTQGFIAGIAGLLVYFAFCSLLKSEEFDSFWNSFKRRIHFKKAQTVDKGEARGM